MKQPWLLTALLVPLACGVERTSTWQAQREVSGDTTTVHTIGGQVWDSVALRQDLTIGVLDGPEELVFGEISRMAEDPDGGIYVLDAQVPQVLHFGRTGEFVGLVGRSGRGPGEYQPLSLGMAVDSSGVLYMHDWGNRRVVRFAPDGSALDPWPLESSFLTTSRGAWIHGGAPGRLLIAARTDDSPSLLVLENGRVTDTLMVPELPGVPEERGGPYRVDAYWGWHPDEYFVVGVSDAYSVEARRSDGVLRVRRDVELLPVHTDEADEWRRRFEWMAEQPSYRPPEGEWLPTTMPPFRGVEVGSDGRIWVQRNTHPVRVLAGGNPNGPPPVTWQQPFVYDVFDADGRFLGEVRFPDRFTPHLLRSGYVWGVQRGEYDEEYVARLLIDAIPE